MASAPPPGSQPSAANPSTQSLTDEEIYNELFPEADESDLDDYDTDIDYTQDIKQYKSDNDNDYRLDSDEYNTDNDEDYPEEYEIDINKDYTQDTDLSDTDSEWDTGLSSRVSLTPSPQPPRPHSAPPPDTSWEHVQHDDALGQQYVEDDSLSGFSDVESENSCRPPVASGSGVCGVTRQSFAASASCPVKRLRTAPHGDNEEQMPSSSVRAGSVRRRASPDRRSTRIPRRDVGVASPQTPGGMPVWSDGKDFVPQIPAFDSTDVGVTDLFPITGEDMSEMSYFTAYFDEPLMEHIVRETNKYAAELIESGEILQLSRLERWKNTTVSEMYLFLALCIMMTHCVKQTITDYWSKDLCIPTPIFEKYMSRDRFVLLLRCFYFANNEDQTEDDRLWRVRHVLNELTGKFRDFYVPAQKLMICESRVLFRRCVEFKKYIPFKHHIFGFKFFVLCDCETGLILHTKLYSGPNIDIPGKDQPGFSESVVKTVMAPWLNKGHILYTDKYYTSPMLTRFLLENRTGVCGTLKARKREMPVFDNDIKAGECQVKKCDQMLLVRWKERREVNMLTTVHTGTMVKSGKVNRVTKERIYKPDCVMDYNTNMLFTDKCDVMVGAIECVRETVKWSKKMFFHLVDITMLNSYNMYLVKTGRKPSFHSFSFSVLSQLLKKFGKEIPSTRRGTRNTKEATEA
nr:piggyBac transposable element-derived protein 4-like isoform X1 [Procambarus clarkii]XP_045620190.1 piggyBac transposable element-derived protein 4-like isoform X1 [Procambarus clarkii]